MSGHLRLAGASAGCGTHISVLLSRLPDWVSLFL